MTNDFWIVNWRFLLIFVIRFDMISIWDWTSEISFKVIPIALIPYFVFSAPTTMIPPPELASAHTYFEKMVYENAYFLERGIIEVKWWFWLIICCYLISRFEHARHEGLGSRYWFVWSLFRIWRLWIFCFY